MDSIEWGPLTMQPVGMCTQKATVRYTNGKAAFNMPKYNSRLAHTSANSALCQKPISERLSELYNCAQ